MGDGLDAVRIAWDDADADDRRRTSRRLIDALLPGAVVRSGPCARCGGSHGRPRVEDIAAEISVAYAGRRAYAASVPRSHAVSLGIDAEEGDDRSPAGVERMRPATTLRDWTRIEAALKADGRGLAVDPALVRIDGGPDAWTATLPGRPTPIVGRDVPGPPGVVLSVAIAPE